MIHITTTGTIVSWSAKELKTLKRQFDEHHCVRLPGLLAAELLQLIQDRINETDFYERIHEGLGSNKELCLREGTVTQVLHLLVNGQTTFSVIRQITGCSRIGCFRGRLYRRCPAVGHHDQWHDDLVEHRMIAMSINLSPAPYSGGILQIRDARSKRILYEAVNLGYGDAIIFRVADYLEHRVTEVEGAYPKTAFAGWFKSQPHFLLQLKDNSQKAETRRPAGDG